MQKNKVLDDRNKRYLSYLYLKEHKYDSDYYLSRYMSDSLFDDDKLFHALEDAHLYWLENSSSKGKQGYYSQVQKLLQEQIEEFQNDHVYLESEQYRIASFFILDFVKENYGLEVMEFKKGDKLEEKMRLMSSSFQLQEELHNIYWYIQNKTEDGYEDKDNDIHGLGEEILMIYKFYHVLISQNQHLFSNPEMACYCQTTQLNQIKDQTKELIIERIKSNNYYFKFIDNKLCCKGGFASLSGYILVAFLFLSFLSHLKC
jgi:hypothetical protein